MRIGVYTIMRWLSAATVKITDDLGDYIVFLVYVFVINKDIQILNLMQEKFERN